MFKLSEKELADEMAGFTTREISQQPNVWKEAVENVFQWKDDIHAFLSAIYTKHARLRVVFTGAGTSAFAGDILAPVLQKENQANIQFEAIATTDMVSNPADYLFEEIPTILVSFGRSGNSPESVAAVNLASNIIKDFYQVIITCNPDGELTENARHDENSLILQTPEQAHDQGFAMTSSFTSMMIVGYGAFTTSPFTGNSVTKIIAYAERLISTLADIVDEIIHMNMERIVYLGSGILSQLSHEAALKMLELSAGKVVAVHESSLGFRHGPKSILNDQTLVVLFMSQDPYTRQYDLDILKELSQENSKVVVLTESKDSEVVELADWALSVNGEGESLGNDFYLAFLYIIFAQILALKKSIQLGITPDNPSPDGKVNRVVKGVTIYEYRNI
ncbi:SIS domain-containing protein [Virgibacillus salexigens]|uniref:SIS domain-containing protein n=1 Tax=Virgibacillus TaxID=84406 RepID=UPI001370A618|nr:MULTISPECIES: SIS domain-containing protein [Virgibacillus]MYL40762.1 SIS domain-containing protein [Virgibacillus massiliensis]